MLFLRRRTQNNTTLRDYVEEVYYYRPLEAIDIRQLLLSLSSSFAYLNVGLTRIFSSAIHISLKYYDPTLYPSIGFGNFSGTIYTAGMIFGALLLAAPLLHFLGRRLTIRIAGIILSIGWILISISHASWFYHMGRVFIGIGVGIILPTVPIYICESVDINRRKSLLAIPGCAIAAGFLLSSASGTIIPWRLHAFFCAILSFSTWFILKYVPESPVWLINNHEHQEAERACHWLRIPERQAVAASHAALLAVGPISFADIVIPLIVSCFSAVVQNLSVLHIFVFYLFDTFETPLIQEHITPIHLGIIAMGTLLGSIVSMLSADRGHRRHFILLSGFICATCTGIFGSLIDATDDIGILSVSTFAFLILIIYGISYGFGYLYFPFGMAAETTPRRFAFLQGPLVAATHALGILLLSFLHPYFVSKMTNLSTFLMYAGLTTLGSTIVWMFAPHTRGMGLHDINRIHFFSYNNQIQD